MTDINNPTRGVTAHRPTKIEDPPGGNNTCRMYPLLAPLYETVPHIEFLAGSFEYDGPGVFYVSTGTVAYAQQYFPTPPALAH